MFERFLNALISLTLNGVMLAAFGVQFIAHETPCPLCLLQRLGMIAVSTGALLNLKFGIRTTHYGLMLLASLAGGFVALRQISLHVCPGFPGFGIPVLGLSLYTWSFIIFVCCVLAVALLLLLYDQEEHLTPPAKLSAWEWVVFGFALFIAAANALAAFFQCGLGPCSDV